jgi:hypothetical protein
MDSLQECQADMRGFLPPEEAKTSGPAVEEVVGDGTDEDAMVDLLIQQHRMQEQMEKAEGEQAHVPGEITEADIAKMQAELEAEEEMAEEEEEGGDKRESIKPEELVPVEEEEKDIFDLAMEEGAVMEDFIDDFVAEVVEERSVI